MTTKVETDTVKIDKIVVREGFNPRHEFDQTALDQLASSIEANGITTALTVRRENGNYELVDGERRLRAAKIAGLKEVPVLIRGDENAEAAALVANVQREDLNPIEEAEALERLRALEGLGTHKALAEQVGKPVAFVSARLKLLALPEGCYPPIASGKIPLAAEPQLRSIAKASPEAAVAACEFVGKDGYEPSDLVDRPDDVLRRLAVEEGGPFICDVSHGATIAELVRNRHHAEALEERTDGALSDGSPYADHLHLHIEEEDVDRLRASRKLLEYKGEWSTTCFLVDSELAADLAEELVDRAITRAEERAKERAENAGVEIAEGAPAAEQLQEAQREERRKDREKAKREAAKAEAFNAELGVALVKRRGAQSRKAHRLNRAKVLARQVIADNEPLAGAGLRLVMPQLRETDTTQLKNGKERVTVTHASNEQCRQYLLDSIDRAKTVDEVLELMADAVIAAVAADERELPRSRRISWWPGVGNDPVKDLAAEIKEVKPKRGKKRS